MLRTDFGNDTVWRHIREDMAFDQGSDLGYEAKLQFVDAPEFTDLDPAELEAQLQQAYITPDNMHSAIVVVDAETMRNAEHPVLLVDLSDEERTPAFRCVPNQVARFEVNISIGNMGFYDFAGAADEDGVFRGFDSANP